jgi:hypothetical protein
LLTGSGDELCSLLPALFQAVAYHPPAVGLPAFPAICLLIVLAEISSLLLLPSAEFLPFLLYASFQFIVYCSVVFFFCVCVGSQSAQGAMLVYPLGGWGNTVWHLVLTCLVCWMSPKQVWSPRLVAVAAHLFSQCNMVWRSFLRARGSGCQSFDSPWCFISAKCGSTISARFLIHRAHAVCFCPLVAIFDPPHIYLKLNKS